MNNSGPYRTNSVETLKELIKKLEVKLDNYKALLRFMQDHDDEITKDYVLDECLWDMILSSRKGF